MWQKNFTHPSENNTGDFAGKFAVPDAALAVIDSIVTPLEQSMIERLPPVFRAEDVRAVFEETNAGKATLSDAEDFLQKAYRRGVFAIEDEKEKRYKTGSFYGRLDIFAISENETYRSFPAEIRKALDEWYFAAYLAGLAPDLSERPTTDEVITLEEAIRGIDEDSRQLYLASCDCRSLSGECGEPVLVCLSYRSGPNTYAHREISRPITKEEGKQVVRMAHEAGLVHTRNHGGICNCCGDCCYLFRARVARNSGALWPRADNVISIDGGNCVSCETCLSHCRFEALTLDAGVLVVDRGKCVGCGICVDICPVGVLKLQKRPSGEVSE